MLSTYPLTDKTKKSSGISVYVKGLGWVAGNSYLELPDMNLKFNITDRLDIYNIIESVNIPYLTEVVKHDNYHEDKTIVERICFNLTTDEQWFEYDELLKVLRLHHSTNGYEESVLPNTKRLNHLVNLLGLYSLSNDTLADEIILSLRDEEGKVVNVYQVTDYLENNPCKHSSNKVCLNYARSLMIRELSKDLVDSITASNYEYIINSKIELEVESSMVTLSGEKEFTRVTRFKLDEWFLSELLQYATKYNTSIESVESNNE